MTTKGEKETQYIEAVFICQVYIPIYFKSMKESKKNDSDNYKEEKNIINKCEKHLVMNTKCHTKKSNMI